MDQQVPGTFNGFRKTAPDGSNETEVTARSRVALLTRRVTPVWPKDAMALLGTNS